MDKQLIQLLDILKSSPLWSLLAVDEPIALELKDLGIVYITFVETADTKEIILYSGPNALYNLRRSYLNPNRLNVLKFNDLALTLESISIIYSLHNQENLLENDGQSSEQPTVITQTSFIMRIDQLTEEEHELLEKVTDFLLSLSYDIQTDQFHFKSFGPIKNGRGIIPLFRESDDSYQFDEFVLPKEGPVEYLHPVFSDELLLTKYMRLPRIDTLQIDILSSGNNITVDNTYYNSVVSFIVDELTGFAFPFISEYRIEDQSEAFLKDLVKRLNSLKLYPERIKTTDERTFYFLKDFADKANIEIVIEDELKELNEAEDSYGQFLGLEQPQEFKESEENRSDSSGLPYEFYTDDPQMNKDQFGVEDPRIDTIEMDFIRIIHQLHGIEPVFDKKEPKHQILSFKKRPVD